MLRIIKMLRQEGLGKYQCLASKWGTVGQDDAKRDSHSHSQSITVYQLKRYHTLLDLDRNFDVSERRYGKRTEMPRGGVINAMDPLSKYCSYLVLWTNFGTWAGGWGVLYGMPQKFQHLCLKFNPPES